ncbi:hypothetical protein N7474_003814 [Penicillium riverlandense]|uniref:uncharacterized protein n=1 Tax=Penicillium riverlandense TaxID=1903569 RepID=UPI0025492985|nr:uncharacterized protein N7474_003814 [Penicillium riverlandense]KAJ5818223.1 hypothetical protein N7474_003814 [Penicillium riverlandense]
MFILQGSAVATGLANLCLLGSCVQASRTPLASWTGCPPDGPLLPRPTNLGSSQIIQDAATKLTEALDSSINGETKAGFQVDNTSFSIALVSPFTQNRNDGIIWSYHHLGKNNFKGTKNISNDSQYLIGSVSKVFSDLLLLKSDIDLAHSVTEYLPGLDQKGTPVQWSNITLSALSNHLAGIPSNLPSSFESYYLRPLFEQLGFPLAENESYPICGVSGLSHACNEQQIIEMMTTALPVQQPYSRPVYSTLAFTLSAMALSEKTGKTYDELLDETIISPLGLTNTGVSPGDTEKAVIPPLDDMHQGWGADYGLNAPGGGLYSSIRDLSTLAARILDYSIFPNPDITHQWLKPQSMPSSINNLVGRPWEIQRTDNLVPQNTHTVNIYAKSGGAMGYISQLSLVDQYGVGFVVLTAGPGEDATASILNDALIASLIPAIDQEAQTQAREYTGNFSIPVSSCTSSNLISCSADLNLSIDRGTGLKIDSLTRNGSDILGGIQKIWGYMIPQVGILNPDFRIYPTNIETEMEGAEGVFFEDWRINFDIVPSDNAAISDLPGQGILSSKLCSSWQTAAWLYYGGEALDRVVFKVNRTAGEVIGVDIPFLRSGILEKTVSIDGLREENRV